jgi:hypothetical protein
MIRTMKKTNVTRIKSIGKLSNALVTMYARRLFISVRLRERGGPANWLAEPPESD